MSRTIRHPTPEMHAALDAEREGRLSHEARAALDTAEREWRYATDAASAWRFGPAQDEEELAARRRRDGAYRRYLTLCHRIGRNYLNPIELKRGMTPMRRAEIAGYVRDVYEDYTEHRQILHADDLMCYAALFAAGNDDGQIVDGLQDLAAEAVRIAAHTADTLDTTRSFRRLAPAMRRKLLRLPELRRRIERGGYLVDSIEKVSRTDAEYNALMDLCNRACPEDYDGPDLSGAQALAILDQMEAS